MREVAEGVWRVGRGFPLRVNSFLVRDGGGVAVFDAGIESIHKLAALEPATYWPGHCGPLKGDVRAQLEAIA